MYSVLPTLLGAAAARQMLPCEASDAAGLSSISGYISALQDSHSLKAHQLLYLNKRCCACDAASNLINDLHEQLLARQNRGQDRHHVRNSTAPARGVQCFPAFVLFLNYAAPQPATGADGAPDDLTALLRLVRTAVLSAWKADVPDSFLRSAAAQPRDSGKQEPGAARRIGYPSEPTPENLPQALPGKATTAVDRKRGAGDIQTRASATVSDHWSRPLAQRRQLMSSEKRLPWHSEPLRCLGRDATGAEEAGDAAASLWQRTQGPPMSPAQDALCQRAANPVAVDLPQDSGRTWAATARLCLSPAQQAKPSNTCMRQNAAAPQCSLPATAVGEHLASRSQLGTPDIQPTRAHGLLEEVLTEDSATERLLHSAARASVAEDRQQHITRDNEARPGAAEVVRPASPAPAGPAATKKRRRRASWPSMPPPKRRAVHKNLPVSMRTAAPAHVASLPTTASTSLTLNEQRKHAQPADSREYAVTKDGTSKIGKQSHTLHNTHGWRQRKRGQPEPSSRARVASAPSHYSGLHASAKPSEDERRQSAAPQPLDALFAAWHNPCIGRNDAEQDVLQLSDLAPGLAYLVVPQAVDRASFMRARVLQQVRLKPPSPYDTVSSH